MEEFNTTVRISGFVLSSLMFHHLNSDADVVSGERSQCDRMILGYELNRKLMSAKHFLRPVTSVSICVMFKGRSYSWGECRRGELQDHRLANRSHTV